MMGGENVDKYIDIRKLMSYFDANSEILHKSRYHKEGFRTHCLLVIGGMLAQYESGKVSKDAIIAACLHDIAKPRTAALNARNEACFYGHENVTREEVANFLNPDYPGFEKVLDLIHGHMLPISASECTPEPFRGISQEQLALLLGRHDKQFEKDLMTLSDCDLRASVKSDEDLPKAEKEAAIIRSKLLQK